MWVSRPQAGVRGPGHRRGWRELAHCHRWLRPFGYCDRCDPLLSPEEIREVASSYFIRLSCFLFREGVWRVPPTLPVRQVPCPRGGSPPGRGLDTVTHTLAVMLRLPS